MSRSATSSQLDNEFFTYLKQKYKLSNDDMGEFLESFISINRGESITPFSLKAFVEDEMDDTDWHIDDCRKIIININKQVNSKPRNYIDLKTYLTYLIPLCCNHVITKTGLREIFDTLDSDFDGKITCDELVSLLYKINKQFEPSEILDYKKHISRLCMSADKDNDGFISYDEFKSFIIDMGMGYGKDNMPIKTRSVPHQSSNVVQSNSSNILHNIGSAINIGSSVGDSTIKRKDLRRRTPIELNDEYQTDVAIEIEEEGDLSFSSAANTFKKRLKRFSDKRRSAASSDKKRYSFPQLTLPQLSESYAKIDKPTEVKESNPKSNFLEIDSAKRRKNSNGMTSIKSNIPHLAMPINSSSKRRTAESDKISPISRRHSISDMSSISTERRGLSDPQMFRHRKPILRHDM